MYTVLVSLAVVIGILLILLVISQKSKGGGLASGFSSPNQVMGVRKTTDFVEKATWTLAVILVVLCIAAVGFKSNEKKVDASAALREKIEATATPENSPIVPVATPEPSATAE